MEETWRGRGGRAPQGGLRSESSGPLDPRARPSRIQTRGASSAHGLPREAVHPPLSGWAGWRGATPTPLFRKAALPWGAPGPRRRGAVHGATELWKGVLRHVLPPENPVPSRLLCPFPGWRSTGAWGSHGTHLAQPGLQERDGRGGLTKQRPPSGKRDPHELPRKMIRAGIMKARGPDGGGEGGTAGRGTGAPMRAPEMLRPSLAKVEMPLPGRVRLPRCSLPLWGSALFPRGRLAHRDPGLQPSTPFCRPPSSL